MSNKIKDSLDVHVHIVGNGSSGSGCWLKVRGYHYLLARYIVRHLGMPQNALGGDLDTLYVSRLLEMVRESSLERVVILAQDHVYNDRGEKLPIGSFYVPNDYVIKLARENKEFVAAASIHPARADALDELEKALAGGCKVLKLLPNCHNVNCNLEQYRPFWQRMANAGMVFLAHTGGELSVPVVNRKFQDPQILELPLQCGVSVIAAHGATSSLPFDQDYLPKLCQMMERFPHLYCDHSALCSPYRSKHLKHFLKEPLRSRLIHGSDLPIPISGLWLWLRGLITYAEYRRLEQEPNLLERDLQLKRACGFPDESFTRLAKLLRN